MHMNVSQFEAFQIKAMALKMQHIAPELWELLDVMLAADTKRARHQEAHQENEAAPVSLVRYEQGVAVWYKPCRQYLVLPDHLLRPPSCGHMVV